MHFLFHISNSIHKVTISYFVLQITAFNFDIIILSKTALSSGSRKEKRNYGQVRNNKINDNNFVIYLNSLS